MWNSLLPKLALSTYLAISLLIGIVLFISSRLPSDTPLTQASAPVVLPAITQTIAAQTDPMAVSGLQSQLRVSDSQSQLSILRLPDKVYGFQTAANITSEIHTGSLANLHLQTERRGEEYFELQKYGNRYWLVGYVSEDCYAASKRAAAKYECANVFSSALPTFNRKLRVELEGLLSINATTVTTLGAPRTSLQFASTIAYPDADSHL